VLRGSCLCGTVTFDVMAEFEAMAFCHCKNCKKLSMTGGVVRTEAIQITAGADQLRTYRPVEGNPKTFCGECGANLFGGGWPDSEYSAIRLTAIDSAFDGGPQLHKYVQSLAPWETLPDDGLPRFDQNPD
jgi:hypothetical protein